MSAARIIERLERVRETGPGTWRAWCVGCDARSYCLSIREKDDGMVFMHCFRSQCEPAAILQVLGVPMAELFPPQLNQHRYPPTKSLMPAREALACIDHEVLVATLILGDVLRDRAFTPEQFDRLSRCAALIGDARAKSCPARVPRQQA